MKKFLKYSLAVISLLVMIFFSPGIFISSFSYESKISVNKPVENSFRVFTNVFLLYEWIPGLKKVEWASGIPNQVGSKWKMTIIRDEQEYVMMEMTKLRVVEGIINTLEQKSLLLKIEYI